MPLSTPLSSSYLRGIPARFFEARGIHQRHPPSRDRDQTHLHELAHDPAHRRAGGAGHPGQVLLRERNDRAVNGATPAFGGVEQAARHSGLDRRVERLDQLVREPPDALGEYVDQQSIDGRVAGAELAAPPGDGQDLTSLFLGQRGE